MTSSGPMVFVDAGDRRLLSQVVVRPSWNDHVLRAVGRESFEHMATEEARAPRQQDALRV